MAQEMAEKVELLAQGQVEALELVFVRGPVLDSEQEQEVAVVPPWVP